MTTAVCWKCGAFKMGLLTECLTCSSTPRHEDDLIISIALSEYCADQDTLQHYQSAIRAGKTLRIDQELKDRLKPMAQGFSLMLGKFDTLSTQYPTAQPAHNDDD